MSSSSAEIKRSLMMLDGEDATIGALIATGRLRHASELAESEGTPAIGHPLYLRADGHVQMRVTLDGLEEFHVFDGEGYPVRPAISHTWDEVGDFLLQGISPADRAAVTAAYDSWFHLHAKIYAPVSDEWSAAFIGGTQTNALRERLNAAHRDVWEAHNRELVPAVRAAVAAVDVAPGRDWAVLSDVLAGLQGAGR